MSNVPTPGTLRMYPVDHATVHRLNIIAEYHCAKVQDGRPEIAIAIAAREYQLARIAFRNCDDTRLDLYAVGNGQFVLAWVRPDAYTWTDADGFDNDLSRWDTWDRDHPEITQSRQSIA